ncbi:TIR domain-containing protein [Streptomyces yaizuensis]|uniref:Toll/interleukin-1 receptor domain-containing protein n=1 Tax=Streptomyces yaizuensis TaxID=2989713 RepID=A0ABQ5NTQ6_9ACTN|nr:TIR domain-containing protein [Streptomyces sp. YSPA8]GLF93637.1 toll/interleukin-1 receptor domain-containing protein [Streptomyces sp. YSPA8]
MPDIFVNYRTGDAEAEATMIDRELSRRFGSERVFRAGKSIPAGRPFPQQLITAVRRSSVLLAVIGARWTEARTAGGGRALDDPGDWTRREILEAMESGALVIPVLVGGVGRLDPSTLPQVLAALADHQYRRLDIRDPDPGLTRLADDLAELVPALDDVDTDRRSDRRAGHERQPEGDRDETPGQRRDSRIQSRIQARDIQQRQRGGIGNVGGDFSGTFVSEPQGPVNTGPGAQHNTGDQYNAPRFSGDNRGVNYTAGDNSGTVEQRFDGAFEREREPEPRAPAQGRGPVTDTDGVRVTGARGPVNTGPGPQFNGGNFGLYVEGLSGLFSPRGADHRRVVREHRIRLSHRFVPPREFGRATARLTAPGTAVLLDGAPGIGRRAAATVLLHRLQGTDGGRFVELSVEPGEGPVDASPGDRFFLDLSQASEDDYPGAQRILAGYLSKTEEGGARLAAVLPAGLDHLLDPELVPLVVRLERPSGIAVLRRYLCMDQVAFTPEQLNGPVARQLLDEAPMRELAALAGFVRQARDRRPGGSFDDWLQQAVDAVTNRTGEVAQKVASRQTAEERALLLAAAMLSGASSDAVFHAARLLLKSLGHPEDETPLLGRADLGARLQSLGIVRDHEGRVGFDKLAYDAAVRTHFWVNFPDLRDGLRDWAGRCAPLRDMTGDDRMNLVSRFGEQALAAGYPDHLLDLATRWTDPKCPRPLHTEAAAALQFGLVHERYGGRFRSRIYDWARLREDQLSPDLAHTLAGVCLHTMAATHPDQALVRLHHLAVRRGGQETVAARTALLELGRRNRRMYRRLIDRLLSRRPDRRETNLALLLALLDPVGAPAPRGLLPQRAWAAVMAERPPAEWTPTALSWLTAACENESWGDAPDILSAAAEGRTDVLNRLYVITCGWARDSSVTMPRRTARDAVAIRLRQRIDRAQGAVPAGRRHGTPYRGDDL